MGAGSHVYSFPNVDCQFSCNRVDFWGCRRLLLPLAITQNLHTDIRTCSAYHSFQAHFLSHQGLPYKDEKSYDISMVPFETVHDLQHAVNQLVKSTPKCDSSLYVFLLRECGNLRSLDNGKRIHEHISSRGLDHDTYIGNHLVEMYAKCGAISAAHSAFDAIHDHNVYSWTIIIAAYMNHGDTRKVFFLFDQMQLNGIEPNNITFISVIGACCGKKTLEQGRHVHVAVVEAGYESDVVVGSALVNMYGKCGSVEEARWVFQRLHVKNCVTWNALIEAYLQRKDRSGALDLFQSMICEDIIPNKVSFISSLGAYSSESTLEQGRSMHAAIIERGYEADTIVGTAIVNMYGRSKSFDDANRTFHRMPSRNAASWNAIISIYTQLKSGVHAIKLFSSLQEEGVIPDNISFVNALTACTSLAASTQGKLIHTQLVCYGLSPDTILETALITMYGKCAGQVDARSVFDKMCSQDVVVWNAMLTAYTQYGHVEEAFQFFSKMLEASVKPDEVTFVGILSVCSRVGMVNEGLQHFLSVRDIYGLTPTTEHYGCMIDLFGRAGLLEEGEEFIVKMANPNVVVWETLLAACQVHGDLVRGKRVAKRVIELNPMNSSAYVLLSNIYAAEGKWIEVAKIREAMALKGLREEPGLSVIEVGNTIHEFLVKDKSHPQAVEIYAELNNLRRRIARGGHALEHTKSLLSVVDNEYEESVLGYHSVKLAIAFGLLYTSSKAPLRVTKNIRVCLDCHSWVKLVSKITERKIVLLDAKHVHEFIDGSCTCGDYW